MIVATRNFFALLFCFFIVNYNYGCVACKALESLKAQGLFPVFSEDDSIISLNCTALMECSDTNNLFIKPKVGICFCKEKQEDLHYLIGTLIACIVIFNKDPGDIPKDLKKDNPLDLLRSLLDVLKNIIFKNQIYPMLTFRSELLRDLAWQNALAATSPTIGSPGPLPISKMQPPKNSAFRVLDPEKHDSLLRIKVS